MVLPRTRGIRGRGTRLKRKAFKKLSAGLVAIICALFSIGLTLEGISISILGQSSLNALSVIGLITGFVAMITAVKLWSQGRKLQKYRIPKKSITQRFKIRRKKRKK